MRTETTRPYYVHGSVVDKMDGGAEISCREISMEMTYDTDDTGHNDGDGTLHHEIRSEDGHGGDSDTRLGSPVAMRGERSVVMLAVPVCRSPGELDVRCADTGEYDGGGAAHGAKEGCVDGTKLCDGGHCGGGVGIGI